MKKAWDRLRDRYHYSLVVFKELVKTDFQLRYQGDRKSTRLNSSH